MAKNKIRTKYNYDSTAAAVFEVNVGPSETMPGQGMTIKELVKRYTQGLPVPQFKPVWYPEDAINEFEGQFDNLSKIERQQMLKDVQDELMEKQLNIKKAYEEQKKARQKKAELKDSEIRAKEDPSWDDDAKSAEPPSAAMAKSSKKSNDK